MGSVNSLTTKKDFVETNRALRGRLEVSAIPKLKIIGQ
jgi:hypothetical protein